MKIVDVGKGHTVVAGYVRGVFNYGSRGVVRLKQTFEKKGLCIDLTGGAKVKTIILLDSYIVLSSVTSDTINKRVESV
jgi:regulator of extracellular matrix RemA (YlzA/DUF370 family)